MPLQSLCTFRGGGTPNRKNEEYFGGRILWISPKDMKSWEITDSKVRLTKAGLANSAAKLIPANSVLVVIRSGVLKHQFPVAINRVPVTVNQDMKALVCKDGVSPDYMARFLKWKSPQVLGWVRGTTADNIPVDRLKTLEVPLPSLAEQHRIAAMLDKADAIRRKRREAIGLLDELLRSAFLEMFGDPVTNPKGWDATTIGRVLSETQYGTSAKANTDGRGLPIVRMNNVTATGKIDLSDIKWCEIPERGAAKYTVRRGDLLFNRTNSPELVGKAAVWDRDEPYALAGYLIRLRVDRTRTTPEYVSGYLNSPYGKQLLFQKAKPSNNMSNISATVLKRLPILVPVLAQQERYSTLVADVAREEARMKKAGAHADDLFNSLAQRAFGGEG